MTVTETSCLVLGAGPAGLSAGLWLKNLGADLLVVDGHTAPGGELRHINLPISNHLGRGAAHGASFLAAVQEQVARAGLPLRLGCEVSRVDLGARTVWAPAGEFRFRALVLATGLTRRMLEVPGTRDYRGRGVSYSATTDMAHMAGQDVAVIGGGDGALENALLVARVARSVTLVHRRPAFSARPSFVERVRADPRIACLLGAEVIALHGNGARVHALEVRAGGQQRLVPVGQVVVKIGFVPNTAVLPPGALRLDEGGYVAVDRWMHTSAPGVFAAGDVCNPRSPCIAAAVGNGAVAAQEAFRFLSSCR